MWRVLFGTATLVHLGYWTLLRQGLARARRTPLATGPDLPPMTVVVAARDEAVRLPALLEALARQTHPPAEVVVVDDASEDATPEVLARAGLPNLRVVRRAQSSGKKAALEAGIAAARHDLLAFTDADGTPAPTWLEAHARAHVAAARRTPAEALVVLGFTPFVPRPGFLNRFQRYEKLLTGLLTAAAAGLGRPYMAFGANVSYSKRLFAAAGGFGRAPGLLSGCDDLFVQDVARAGVGGVRFVTLPQAHVATAAAPTLRAWQRQKRRHASAGRHYDRPVQAHLALFQAAQAGLWLAPLLAGRTGAALLALKLLVQAGVLARAADAFGEPRLRHRGPLLDACYALYNLAVVPLGLLRPPRRW